MKVIIHADDFGVSYGVNEAIEKAFTKGILTSTSIRTNGAAYNDAVNRYKRNLKNIGLGLHLNLTDGKTHLKNLANKSGNYTYSFPEYLLYSLSADLKNNIYNELEEQFRIIKKSELPLDHVDGQDHVHMIPQIFDIVCALCVKYKIKAIRVAHEPLYSLSTTKETLRPIVSGGFLKAEVLAFLSTFNMRTLKEYGLVTTDAYFGVLHTNFMTEHAFTSILKYSQQKKLKSIEIACHPGLPHDKRDTKHTSSFFEFYTNLPARKMELESLLNPHLKKLYSQKGISLSRFSDLVK